MLFRLLAVGKPTTLDKHFDPTSTLVEERVVLFKANDFEDAIKQAEDDAHKYCEENKFVNIYGQSVTMKFMGAVDAFFISDVSPSAGSEVYSSSTIVPRSVSKATLINERFGKVGRRPETRYKFADGGILKDALAATNVNRY